MKGYRTPSWFRTKDRSKQTKVKARRPDRLKESKPKKDK